MSMNLKTAIGETRRLYSGNRAGDAAARCALNEIEHYFVCPTLRTGPYLGQVSDAPFPDAEALGKWQRYLTDELGNGASRANSKLSVLRQVYKTAGMQFPDQIVKPLVRSKAPKWILTEDQEERLIKWMAGPDAGHTVSYTMGDYVPFVLETGLRVAEVLRLRIEMLHENHGRYSVEVPGTKTVSSYDIIPISDKAAKILLRRNSEIGDQLFPANYATTISLWDRCRQYLGLLDTPTATLKGLRRTFAYRHRHLPPAILQRLLRHTNLATTSEYLNVTGMNEDLRGYLNTVEVALAGAGNGQPKRTVDADLLATSMRRAGFSAREVAEALASL